MTRSSRALFSPDGNMTEFEQQESKSGRRLLGSNITVQHLFSVHMPRSQGEVLRSSRYVLVKAFHVIRGALAVVFANVRQPTSWTC